MKKFYLIDVAYMDIKEIMEITILLYHGEGDMVAVNVGYLVLIIIARGAIEITGRSDFLGKGGGGLQGPPSRREERVTFKIPLNF